MKRVIFVILALSISLSANADKKMLKSTTPNNVPIASIVCGGTDSNSYGVFSAENTYSAPYPMKGAVGTIGFYSVAGSSCSVVMETAPTASGPWSTQVTDTDPTAKGYGYSIPLNVDYVRVGIPTGLYVSGSVYFCISVWRPVQMNPVY